MKTARFAIAGILALFSAATASAQQFPVVPDRSVIGRIGVGGQSGPSQAIPLATLKAQLLPGTVNVKDYGATGNGTTDDTTAIQTAVGHSCGTIGLGGSGAGLYFPAGFYKITASISITCGIDVFGDGWAGDSGALVQNQIITTNANLSGSIIEPTSTVAGLVFSTNQAVQIRDIAVVYLSRPAAASGIAAITIKASTAASAPAPLAWNIGSHIDHVWFYGADRDLILTNDGTFNVTNSLFQMHATTGVLIQGPNLPFAGDWNIGPGNTFYSGSITTCQHVLITSGGGGRIQGNKFNTCGSVNVIGPLTTTGVQWSPDLNVANNSLEPIVVVSNTMEGLTRCLWFYGGNVGQNATATQFAITGNQMWCLEDIRVEPTSTNGQWVSGGTISGNYMTAQTQAGISTTTNNININGANRIGISGNVFGLVQGAGGDTSTAINLGAFVGQICQMANSALDNVSVPGTVPLCLSGASGIDTNILLSKTANYTIANTDCGKTIQAGTGSSGLFTVTLPAVTGFTSTCAITVINGDTGREKVLSGFPSNTLAGLWPGQTVQVKIINGAWFTTIQPGKYRPTSAVVFNVSTTGTDTFGCALGTGSSACATGQFAMNLMCTNVDGSLLPSTPSPQMTIQYAAGAYTSSNIINSFCDPSPLPFSSSMQNGWLKIAGNTNLTSVTLACGASTCFSPVHSTAGWWIEGFATTGTGYSVVGDAGTHLYLGTNKFGTTGGSAGDVNAAYGSLVEFEANFTTTGSKNQFVSANQSGSRVIFKPVTVTLSSSTFTIPYTVSTGAIIIAGGATYSGTATVGAGNCYNTSLGGGLETDGALAALVTACGGSAGTTTNPGWAN